MDQLASRWRRTLILAARYNAGLGASNHGQKVDMQEKAVIPVSLLDDAIDSPYIRAWFEIAHLKQLYRQGWLQRGIPPAECETVAEHTFGNAMLCLILAHEHPLLDHFKVLRLALLHDLGEVYVGDITPRHNIPKAEKTRLETAAILKILEKLPGGQSLIADWHEYEDQVSPEARFVKQIDRLELAMQASVYAHQGKVDATEFFDAASTTLKSPVLIDQLDILKSLQTNS